MPPRFEATGIAGQGDMHRVACRLGSRDQATSIAMVASRSASGRSTSDEVMTGIAEQKVSPR
jgi:hypothetical protein